MRKVWSPNLIAQRVASGRGQGDGPSYVPWHRIQDGPSRGRVHRIMGPRTGRVHHLLSDLERNFFVCLHLSDRVTDIREHVALLPLNDTASIATACGVMHPVDPHTKCAIVMTTDFLVTSPHGTHHAVATTYARSLENPRTLEKMEIERRYWKARDISWSYITENQLPPALVANALWLMPYHNVSDLYPLTGGEVDVISSELTSQVRNCDLPLCQITTACDQKLGLRPGQSLAVTRHLLARRVWRTNLLQPICPTQPLHLL